MGIDIVSHVCGCGNGDGRNDTVLPRVLPLRPTVALGVLLKKRKLR